MNPSQPIEVKIYEASEEEDDQPCERMLSSSYAGPSSAAPQHLFTPVTMSEVGREGRQWLTTRSVKRIDCRSMESLRQQSSTTTSSAHLSTASSCSLRSMESLRSSSTESAQNHSQAESVRHIKFRIGRRGYKKAIGNLRLFAFGVELCSIQLKSASNYSGGLIGACCLHLIWQ